MAATIRAVNPTGGSTTTSATAGQSSSTQIGDLLLMEQLVHGASLTISTPSGWNTFPSGGAVFVNGSYTFNVAWFWKIAAAAGSQTYAMSWGGASRYNANAITSITAGTFDPSNPIADAQFQANNTSSTSMTFPSASPSMTNALSILYGAIDNAPTGTPPAGYTEAQDNTIGPYVASNALGSSGATGTKVVTITGTGDPTAAGHIAVAPFPSPYLQALSATVGFAGSQSKATSRPLSAGLGLAGGIRRMATRSLAGSITPSGAFLTARLRMVALSAGLGFTGASTRTTGRGLAASLGLAGLTSRVTARRITGSVGPSASLTRGTSRPLVAVASLSGTVTRRTARALSAVMAGAGQLARATARSFPAAVGLAGTVRRTAARLLTAALAPAGTVVRRTSASFLAALQPGGLLRRGTARSLTSSIGTSGSVAKLTARSFVASVASSGLVASLLNHLAAIRLAGLVRPSARAGEAHPRSNGGRSAPEMRGGED